ncbi:hypothetical protein [Mycobacterium camsae]|nr:hypothetical protein [Mycobacterium gordonae]
MADTSDLHPDVLHALRTGTLPPGGRLPSQKPADNVDDRNDALRL